MQSDKWQFNFKSLYNMDEEKSVERERNKHVKVG